MKICIMGKYPPIQGGVSTRTYWTAHGLAKLGHTVHVITNARETAAPYRMLMQQGDWARCDATYGAGSVKVHWTEPYGRRQWHIPRGTPYITKLASLGISVAKREPLDVVFSYYMEPYCVAAHIVAQATGLPQVIRTAGSDAGRLWRLPQFAPLYDHVFRSAAAVICGPSLEPKMIDIGVQRSRLRRNRESLNLCELFSPDGPALNVEGLRQDVLSGDDAELKTLLFGEYNPELIYIGVYGKLGRSKGSFALLQALKKMKDDGKPIGLLAMAHEPPMAQNAFRNYAMTNALHDRICQLPFLPHWRVPEFIRACAAVCCLEQDFPIVFHTPVVAREVLTSGACLVGALEVIRKLPSPEKMVDGYNCLAIPNVNVIEDLVQKLTFAIENADGVRQIGVRAREYARIVERENVFPQGLASILADVVQTAALPRTGRVTDEASSA